MFGGCLWIVGRMPLDCGYDQAWYTNQYKSPNFYGNGMSIPRFSGKQREIVTCGIHCTRIKQLPTMSLIGKLARWKLEMNLKVTTQTNNQWRPNTSPRHLFGIVTPKGIGANLAIIPMLSEQVPKRIAILALGPVLAFGFLLSRESTKWYVQHFCRIQLNSSSKLYLRVKWSRTWSCKCACSYISVSHFFL